MIEPTIHTNEQLEAFRENDRRLAELLGCSRLAAMPATQFDLWWNEQGPALGQWLFWPKFSLCPEWTNAMVKAAWDRIYGKSKQREVEFTADIVNAGYDLPELVRVCIEVLEELEAKNV